MVKAVYTKIPWKYALTKDFTYLCQTGVKEDVVEPYYSIYPDGVAVWAGYVWDGASGPTIDTENSVEPSLIHDVLYQAIREKRIPRKLRRRADRIFRKALKLYGMTFLRRQLWFWSVRIGGRTAV